MKNKRIFAILAVAVMCACSVFSLAACASDGETDSLVIYNWADYMYDGYEEEFSAYYKQVTGKDIKLTYVTFDTNETMITKITKGDTKIDVMCPSEYAIQKLLQTDYLVPLNYFDGEQKYTQGLYDLTGYVHNANNVQGQIVEKISADFSGLTCTSRTDGKTYTADMVDYMVPYMYGTLGILYNRARFEELGITAEKMNRANWGILFNDSGMRDEQGNVIPLSDALIGSILMKDSIRDSYAATLFYLVESGALDGKTDENGKLYTDMSAAELINCVDDNTIEACKDALTAQKEQLFGYEVDFGKDDLLKGNAMVDLAWSGDAMYAVEESWNDSLNGGEGGYELGYYVPHTYGNIWFDGWVVPTTYNPEHITAIKLFINFLNTPRVAAENMYTIGYSSAVAADKVEADDDAKSALARLYFVNCPYYEFTKEELAENDGEYAYDNWDDFADEFFRYEDEVDNSNWRYPFVSATEDPTSNRNLATLGMMRDFGDRNKQVVTMWNYARSAGVSALPVFGLFVAAIAVAVGAVVAVRAIVQSRKNKKVIKHNK